MNEDTLRDAIRSAQANTPEGMSVLHRFKRPDGSAFRIDVNHRGEATLPTRVVRAPREGHSTTAGPISVSLHDDEDVVWTYCNNPDGSRSVTGYTIIKKPSA